MNASEAIKYTVEETMEMTLQEISNLTKDLMVKSMKYDNKIKDLAKKKSDATKELQTKLETAQRSLQDLAITYNFTDDVKTIKFAIGTICVRKQPNVYVITDEKKVVAALKRRGFDNCIKTVETVVKKAIENLGSKVIKAVGIQIDIGKNKHYYKLSQLPGVTSAVGLDFKV